MGVVCRARPQPDNTPAELGEGGFRMNPIGVVAKEDQHLGGGVGTDAKALTQRRRGLGGESTQVTVVRRSRADGGGIAAQSAGERSARTRARHTAGFAARVASSTKW